MLSGCEVEPENVPLGEVQTMDGDGASSKSQEPSMVWLFVSFAVSAVLLVAIGTEGVVSFSTAQHG
jgi:hypothetical protein